MKIQDVISVFSDPVIRKMYQDNPRAAYQELKSRGHLLPDLPDEQELKVVTNTADKMYIVLPAVERHTVDRAALARIQAAGRRGPRFTPYAASANGTLFLNLATK